MAPIMVLLKEPEASSLNFTRLTEESGVVVRVVNSVGAAMPLLPETEILITLGPHLGAGAAAVFKAARNLRWVQLVSTGTDNVAEHLAGTGITLTSTRGLHGNQMSEAALCAMLALSRQLPRILHNQRAHIWDRFPATLLHGKTVGILGMGAIADTLAPLCRALGMRVVGITGTPRPAAHFDVVRSRANMATAVADLDHLVLLAPYSAATHHLIDAATLAAMKPSAFLINLARGGIVDETALLAALDAGAIAGAALDVFAAEPLPAQSPFWAHPRVMVSPHIGGFHDGYAADVIALTADNLSRYIAHGPAALRNRVDLAGTIAHAAQ